MIETVTFNIQNTTNGTIPLSLFGNNADPMDNANATTRYFWNVSSLTITNEQSIYIQYKTVGQANFSTATTSFSGNTIQSVVDALNTLNIGSFFITTSGASTFINNYNLNLVFGTLSIYSSITTSLSYSITLLSAGGSGNIKRNGVNQITLISPYTNSGTISIVNGDNISINGITTTSINNQILIQQTNNQTGITTTLYTLTPAPTTIFSQSFIVSNGFSYTITWTD